MMFLDWLASHPQWKKPSTVKGVVSIVNAVMNWSVRMKLIPSNPFQGMPPLESGEPRRSMTPVEFRALSRTTDKRFRRWLRFLWCTGARPGEGSSLRWAMIDWENSRAILGSHKTYKKTGKPRVIPLPYRLLRLLRAMYNRDVKNGRSDDFVFRTSKETKWSRWYTSTKMQRLRPRAGVASDCVPYCARHAFGTAGAMLMPIKLVSVCMGHTDTKVTERYYTHLEGETEALRSVSEAIAAARRK